MILIVISVIIFIYIGLWWPLRNPYKFNLYIGKKGSGKTTLMTQIALRYLNSTHTYWESTGDIKVTYRGKDKNGNWHRWFTNIGRPIVSAKLHNNIVRTKWTVYSNVDLNIPGIKVFNARDLGTFVPEGPAIVLIDEVNLIWDNRGTFSKDPKQKLSTDTQAFFRLSRQYRCRIYAFSQTFDTDRKLRMLADNLWLCRSFGIHSLIRKIDKRVTIKESALDADSQIVDDLKFAPWWIPGNIQLLSLRKYRAFFKSYNPPARPEVPFHWSANTYLLDQASTDDVASE